MPQIGASSLLRYATEIFRRAGVRATDATIVANHLVESNLMGHDSHGVMRIPQYVSQIRNGEIDVGAQPEFVREGGNVAVLDGKRGFGQVVAQQAMQRAVEMAGRDGIGSVAARNSSHTGRIAAYTILATKHDCLGIALANAGGNGQWVAPFGGLARRLSTNPISIAAPTGGKQPLVMDFATSVAPEGKVRFLHQQQKPVPPGWIIDSQGKPTTLTNDLYQSPGGALLPFGGEVGYKSFGLAVMIDVLAGALSGAGCCRPDAVGSNDGLLLIAISIERFAPLVDFCRHVDTLVAHIKSSPPAPGFEAVRVPGEIEWRQVEVRQREGLTIDEGLWQQMQQLATEYEVDRAWLQPAL